MADPNYRNAVLRDITDSDLSRRGRLGRVAVIAVALAILAATVIAVQPKPASRASSPHATPPPLPRSGGLIAADVQGSGLWLATGGADSTSRLWQGSDDGRTWSSLGLPEVQGDVFWLHRSRQGSAYLVTAGRGGEYLLSVDDGAVHWHSYALPHPPGTNLDSITFTADGHGVALFVGEGSTGRPAYLYSSVDGAQWQLAAGVDAGAVTSSGLTLDSRTGPIAFADAMHGIMASGSRGVYVTADGGQDWTFHPLPAPPGDFPLGPDPVTVAAVDGAYLLGMAFRAAISPAAAFVYQSLDGGTTWSKPISAPTDDGFLAPAFAGSRVWWIGSGKAVLMSSDGGRNWLRGALDIPGTARVRSIYPLDDRRAWAFAGGAGGLPQLLFETIDGGTTWSARKPPA